MSNETESNKPQIPVLKADIINLDAQVSALKELPLDPASTVKRLTEQLNSLKADNHRLTDNLQAGKKELEKYREFVLKAQAEAKAATAEKEAVIKALLKIEESVKQLRIENENLKSQIEAARVLLKIPILKTKIVYTK